MWEVYRRHPDGDYLVAWNLTTKQVVYYLSNNPGKYRVVPMERQSYFGEEFLEKFCD